MTPTYLVIMTTLDSEEAAKALATQLVNKRLVACAQILSPIQSYYWWNEAVESSKEWLVVLKTTEACWPALEQAVLEQHPYEVPQLTALPLAAIHAPYASWLNQQVQCEAGS